MATKLTMTAHEALAKIKLYNNKIEDGLGEVVGLAVFNKNEMAEKANKDLMKNRSAKTKSLLDLIKNRDIVKKALIKSNSIAKVTVAGEEMTVAEAIAYRDTIINYIALLDTFRCQYDECIIRKNKKNKKVNADILELKKTILGNSEDTSKLDVIDDYYEKNKYEIQKITDFDKITNELTEKTETYLNEIDFKLSTSNAITTFEVELV